MLGICSEGAKQTSPGQSGAVLRAAPPWVMASSHILALKERNKRSIPNVLLIEFYLMPSQKRTQFILKRHFAMMLFLILNISLDGSFIGWAHRKCRVPVLPIEIGVG